MTIADTLWGGLLAAAAALEAWAIWHSRGGKDAGTFTNLVRRVFHTDTPVGRAAFATVWAVFAIWFGWHILAP